MKRLMSFIRRILPKNRFARSVSVLVGGTALGQAVMVMVAPILTRIYSPQDLGMLAVFVALLSFISVVACLRYEVAIPLPDNEHEASALLVLSLFIIPLVAGLSAIPIYLYRVSIAQLLNSPGLANYLFLLPLGAAFAAAYSALNFWAVRMKAFTSIAKSRICQSVTVVSIQLGGASLGPIALVLGQVTGHATGSIFLSLGALKQRWKEVRSVKWTDIIHVARKYKTSPQFSIWTAMFNTAGSHLPAILFAILFSPAAAGIYALANRVLLMPIQLLGQATANVFFSGAAQAHREDKLSDLVASVHGRLAHIGMPPILVLLIAGPTIFSHVFGPEWRDAGIFAQWLSPWLYLVMITSPLTSTFLVLGKQAHGMVHQAILLTVRVLAISIGAWIGDLTTAVALLAIGSAACALVNLGSIFQMSGNSLHDIWRPTANALAWAILLVSPVILTTIWDIDWSLWGFAFAAAFLFVAARYTYLMKNAWQ